MLYPNIKDFIKAEEKNTHCLKNEKRKHDEKIAERICKKTDCMRVQMPQPTFDPAEPVSVHNFPATSKATEQYVSFLFKNDMYCTRKHFLCLILAIACYLSFSDVM